MIARIRKDLDNKEKGFTLIELLVVIIIIGILAAIAIPLFLNQRKKAEDAAARADVSAIGKEIATWYVDNTETPVVTATGTEYFLTAAGSTGDPGADDKIGNQSPNVELGDAGEYDLSNATEWCIYVTNAQGDKAKDGIQYAAQGGLSDGTCGGGGE